MAKTKSRRTTSKTKSRRTTSNKTKTKPKVARRAKASSSLVTKKLQARAFVGFDGAGRIGTVVLDETGTFVATEALVAIPAASLRVKQTKAGARLVVMDLSGLALLPAPIMTPAGKFDPERLQLQTLELTRQATDKMSEIGHRLAASTSELGRIAADKASEIGHQIVDTTSELGKKVTDSGLGLKAVETATQLGKKAAEKASEIGHRVVETTSELGKKVADSGIGQKAVETTTEIGKKAADAATNLVHSAAKAGSLGRPAADNPDQRNGKVAARGDATGAGNKRPRKAPVKKLP